MNRRAADVVYFLLLIPCWLAVRGTYRSHVDTFFETMHTPVDFEKEVGHANDAGQLKIIGLFSLAIGTFIALLVALPGNDAAGRLGILFVGGTVAIVGLFMWIASRRSDRAKSEPAAPEDPDSQGDVACDTGN